MDAPLFGEEKPRDKFLQYLIGFVLLVGVIVSFVLAFINAYKANGVTNIILSVTVAISFGLIVTLWRWYRVGDLDPKFRYFMAILMVNMLLTVIVGALYATSFDLNSECASGYYIIPGSGLENTCITPCRVQNPEAVNDFGLYVGDFTSFGLCINNVTGSVPAPVIPTAGPGSESMVL